MRKLLLALGIFTITATSVFAAKIPDDVTDYINKTIPGTDIRFDGVIILPDNTVYLPLFPSLFTDINQLKIKESFPANQSLKQKPDIIIFNNDFVLLKVLNTSDGRKTVKHLTNPPLQVRTGLLPQDMLVPSGLVLPENIKGIIGNLKVDTQNEDVIKLTEKESYEELIPTYDLVEKQSVIPQIKDKTIYATTKYSKNIQVLEPGNPSQIYTLAQKSIPVDIKVVNDGKFLLITSYERPFLDVISVADSRFIKQINLPAPPQEILINPEGTKAYVAAPTLSTIFVVDIKTMSLCQKIKVNGYCEKLLLKDNKLFYVDKLKSEIWTIELDNQYTLKNIGKFPNISALAFTENKIFIASRTKSRIAAIDYSTLGLIKEFTTVNKPISMMLQGKYLYVLGAQDNVIEKIDTNSLAIVDKIELNTDGFSTSINRIDDSDLAVITDVKKNCYTIFDLNSNKILKTYIVNVPINEVIITKKIKLFDEIKQGK